MGGMELLARLRAQRSAGGSAASPKPQMTTTAIEAKDGRNEEEEAKEWTAPQPTNRNRCVSLDVCGGVDCAGTCAALTRRHDLANRSVL